MFIDCIGYINMSNPTTTPEFKHLHMKRIDIKSTWICESNASRNNQLSSEMNWGRSFIRRQKHMMPPEFKDRPMRTEITSAQMHGRAKTILNVERFKLPLYDPKYGPESMQKRRMS